MLQSLLHHIQVLIHHGV